jgi:Tfp pilus assembly protein PilF
MRRLVTVLVIGAALTGTSFIGCAHSSTHNEERAVLYTKMGSASLAKGNYPGAMSELSKALELDPKNPLIHNNIALVYDVRGRKKEAEEHFRKAIELNARFTEARVNLSRLLIDQGRYKEAMKQLKAAENDLTYDAPDRVSSLMGMLEFKRGNYKDAESHLEKAMSAKRSSCVTANFYGRTLYEEKKTRQAADILDHAIENCRGTKFDQPLYYSALAYYKLGENEKSKSRLEELIKKYPDSDLVSKARGLLAILQ